MGSSIWKVDPLPTVESTQMRPPCISNNLLGNGEAKASTAFGLGIRVIDLMELLEDSCPLPLRDARASVHHTDREVSVDSFSGHADLTFISELDGIADEIEQHLRKALFIADANRQRFGHRGC